MAEGRQRSQWDQTALLAALSFGGKGKYKDYHPLLKKDQAVSQPVRTPAEDFALISQLLGARTDGEQAKQ